MLAGTIYSTMHKTTVYLPDSLRENLAREARRRGISEAELIRLAIAEAVRTRRPKAGFLDAQPIADRVEELLEGFGSR